MVYLDLTHIDRETLNRKLEGILEIYEKFVGDDPRDVPMKIFPGMHYTMGGLWVDFNQATNIKGIFAAGECEYGTTAPIGSERTRWCPASMAALCRTASRALCKEQREVSGRSQQHGIESERKRQEEANAGLLNSNGTENPFRLWRELGELMTATAPSSAITRTCSRLTPSWLSSWSASTTST